jgi:hypothetical protein
MASTAEDDFSDRSVPEIQKECLSLILAINNQDSLMLNYLFNELKYLWTSRHLGFMLEGSSEESWEEGIRSFLGGTCAHYLYNSMNYDQKLDFIGDDVGSRLSTNN